MSSRVFGVTLLAAAVAVSLGCSGESGPKTALVSGTVTKGGKPWSLASELGGAVLPPGDAGCTLVFTSKPGGKAKGGEDFRAALDPATGSFKVGGAAGKGIPAGDYDAVVYLGAFGAGPSGAPKKGAAPTSMYGREVARKAVTVTEAGPNEFAIDLPAK